MDTEQAPEIRLTYRDEFRSVHGDTFQHWFERLALAIHGDDCFVSVRVTRGDGGLDGLVLKEGRVYQLYAPPTLGTDPSTATKVRTDFEKAKNTLGASLKIWTFVHNSQDGKVGHLTARALAELHEGHPGVQLEALGIDGLWERLASLPHDKLAILFGAAIVRKEGESRIRSLLDQASELDDQDKRDQAFETTEQALAIARAEQLVDTQAEILCSLCLMASTRSGRGDRQHYFQQLQPLRDRIVDARILIMYHRAHALCARELDEAVSAEPAFLSAIAIASQPENADRCGTLLSVVRSEYVHFLCDTNRSEEAKLHLELSEMYARQDPLRSNGEVFQAAMSAGLHWAAVTRDEDAAVERVAALESSATTSYRAMSVAGTLLNAANGLSHRECHRAALVAADAALRLSEKVPDAKQARFVPVVLYTIAMIHFYAGRHKEALDKANALIGIPKNDDTAPIRFAAAQLVSVISRQLGDFDTAVDRAEVALGLAPEIDSSFMAKMNLAESLADRGQTERALELVLEAHHLVDGRRMVPKDVQLSTVADVAKLAAQLGRDAVLLDAMTKMNQYAGDDHELLQRRDRYAEFIEGNREIRKRLIDISLVGRQIDEIKLGLNRVNDFRRLISTDHADETASEGPIDSLRQANALTVGPVIRWWKDLESDDYNAAALDYDYWGRGCFAQILRNLQAFPHSLNVTVEVRSVHDIRQALRLWSLYADFVLLLWKGPTKSGQFLHIVDGEWFGPWGAGYILALGDKYSSRTGRLRFPAMGYGSWLPEDAAKCLVTEAEPFLASGRMLLVPASGVGCVSPGHGVMEQLLTEVANCVPAIQHRQESELGLGVLPYARDIPLDLLLEFIEDQEDALLTMRSLMFVKAADIRRNGLQEPARAMEREIADALRRLRSENSALARRRSLTESQQDARIGVSPFSLAGQSLIPGRDSGFSPLLTLESIGYGWKVGTRSSSVAYRYAPAEGEAIGAWLAPPEPGVRFLAMKPASEGQEL